MPEPPTPPSSRHSLLAHFIWQAIVPLTIALFGVIIVSSLAYQKMLVTLLIDRDYQLASLAAARVWEVMEGYGHLLSTLAALPELAPLLTTATSPPPTIPSEAQKIFNAGIAVTNANGHMVYLLSAPNPIRPCVTEETYFQQARQHLRPAYSDVVTHALTGKNIIIIAVPITHRDQFAGALIGAMYLDNAPLEESMHQLTIGQGGFAYLVDNNGRVIFHPRVENIGADFNDRPFVRNVIAGESGGTLWVSPSGEQLVQGYVPITATGWGLIVREPWEAVSAPARLYGASALLSSFVVVLLSVYLLWRSARDISRPIRHLAQQSLQLAAGQKVEAFEGSRMEEVDTLGRAFDRMASQIAVYRAGLRRYLGAITHSQEAERQRIAHELHDETAQSLLAITRHLELYQSNESNPTRRAQLHELQLMLTATLEGVRRISYALRPPALDDLGLIPALQGLVDAARTGPDTVTTANLIINGSPYPLLPDRELALYRIVQEALNNVRRHAQAKTVEVELTFTPSALHLTITDDGIGFVAPPTLATLAHQGHFGLMDIQERVWAMNGELEVITAPGQGTRLHITLPQSTAPSP